MENMQDTIVWMIVALCAAIVVWRTVRRLGSRNRGGCGCHCEGCPTRRNRCTER